MKYGKTIRLDGVSFNNPNLPSLRNFQELIANHAHCIGAWRMDGADALTLDGAGGVQSFANWKTGGSPLALGGGQAAVLIDNALSGGKIARFGAACEYRLNGYAWDLAKSYTMVAVYKPDSYASINNICGDINAGDMTKTSGIFSRSFSAVPALAFFEANNTTVVNIPNPNALVAALVRHDAPAKVNYVTGIGVGSTNAPALAPAAAGTLTFKVSDQTLYPFVGGLDFVALFDINTATDAALQVALADYLAIRVKAI